MANEITITASLSATKGGVTVSSGSLSKSLDMSGDDMLSATQNVGTAWEDLTIGEVGTIGYLLLRNLDSTNYVEVAYDAAGADKFAKIPAGAFCLFQPNSSTIHVKANSSACVCQVCVIEA